jgi:hypothetical protein
MPFGILLSLAFEFGGVDGIDRAPLFTNPTYFQIKTEPETYFFFRFRSWWTA